MTSKNTQWTTNNNTNFLHISSNTAPSIPSTPIQISLDKPEALITIEENVFCVLYFILRDKFCENKITVELVGENSEVELLGIFYGNTNLQFNTITRVIHKNKNTKSKTVIRGVLLHNSSSVYNGLIRVEKNASNVCASLEYRALLLSGSAKAKPIPSLEILNNDVQVNHGVSVGRIGEEDLFYLTTRGLSEDLAKETILKGFLSQIEIRVGL